MKNLEIFETQDGSHSIFATEFGVSYHSKYGAIQETQHVFIDAALRFKAVLQRHIAILEIGFGTGLNAYMTYLEGRKRNLTINYVTVEAYPLSYPQAQCLNYPDLLQVSEEERQFFLDMHATDWNEATDLDEDFTLTKLHQRFEQVDFQDAFDIIYFDAFAPNAQPELWETPVISRMYNALRSGGILVTYCAKGAVKRTFKSVGFDIEALQGPPGKREMTRAIKP